MLLYQRLNQPNVNRAGEHECWCPMNILQMRDDEVAGFKIRAEEIGRNAISTNKIELIISQNTALLAVDLIIIEA